jgi:hypoxanthine phosphoribosyltransferase
MERNIIHELEVFALKIHNPYKFLSFEGIDREVEKLYSTIRKDGYIPDKVIGILNGGFYPALKLGQKFQCSLDFLHISHYALRIGEFELDDIIFFPKLYDKIIKRKPRLIKNCDGVCNKKILIVDDDGGGETMNLAIKTVSKGAPSEIRTAALVTYEGRKKPNNPYYFAQQKNLGKLIKDNTRFPWIKYSPFYKDYVCLRKDFESHNHPA